MLALMLEFSRDFKTPVDEREAHRLWSVVVAGSGVGNAAGTSSRLMLAQSRVDDVL